MENIIDSDYAGKGQHSVYSKIYTRIYTINQINKQLIALVSINNRFKKWSNSKATLSLKKVQRGRKETRK